MIEVYCTDKDGNLVERLTQWDVDQYILIGGSGLTEAPKIHFCNAVSDEALVVGSEMEGDLIKAKIPNILLQDKYLIMAYLYVYDPTVSSISAMTKATIKIPILPRQKPSNYPYVEDIDYISATSLEAKIEKEIEDLTNELNENYNQTLSRIETSLETEYKSTTNAIREEYGDYFTQMQDEHESMVSDYDGIKADYDLFSSDLKETDSQLKELSANIRSDMNDLEESYSETTINLENRYSETIDDLVSKFSDGSPKGYFSNVEDLSGKVAGVYINDADGYVYYWDGETISDAITRYEYTADTKAPTSHASSSIMYGVGTSTEYGHLKVADNLTTTTSGTALSANQGKVLSDKISNVPIKYMEKGSTASTNMSTNATVGTDAVIVGDLRSRSYGTVISGAVATGDYSLALGTGATAIGSRSTSIGYSSTTSGAMSQSLGYNAYTSSQYALALGYNAKANGRSSIAMLAGTASGKQAFALGQNALASGDYSLAIALDNSYTGTENETRQTTAEASGAISIGNSNKVTADRATAIGGTWLTVEKTGSVAIGGFENTISISNSAVIAGYNNTMSSDSQHGGAIILGGEVCTTDGGYSFTTGLYNNAHRGQFKIGHMSKDGTTASVSGTTGDAFIIGNGTRIFEMQDDGNYGYTMTTSNAFRVSYSGGVYGGAAYNSSGADIAELYEWQDGNPEGEDRRGLFVTLDGTKIRLANEDDTYIKGAISARPCLVGDSASEDWHGKYMTDVFGALLTQTVHHDAIYKDVEKIDSETGEKKVEKELVSEEYDSVEFILNPEYNDEEEYIPREKRPEYDYVSSWGKIVLVDDGSCEVNGFAKPGKSGKATKSKEQTIYRVMKRIDENHIFVAVG